MSREEILAQAIKELGIKEGDEGATPPLSDAAAHLAHAYMNTLLDSPKHNDAEIARRAIRKAYRHVMRIRSPK